MENKYRIIDKPHQNDENNTEDIYEEVWLPVGDYKNADIERLLEQGRIKS
ncbi:MAG TPA: hypothetical protein VHQ70_03225 [Syntrophomonadaceae bacterium]|nr:hypothetical protein [Syntrophomonadaceae bacterium]